MKITSILGIILFFSQNLFAGSGFDKTIEDPLNYNTFCFYYNWYGNIKKDGKDIHWAHPVMKQGPKDTTTTGYLPGGDNISSNFFPQLGTYSCTDTTTINRHMEMLVQARIGVIVLTWWNVHDFGYQSVPMIMDLAARHGIKVCFHIEPFSGRNAETTRQNIQTIVDTYGNHQAFYRKEGKPLFFIYDSYLTPPEEWKTLLRPDGKITIRNTSYDAIMIGLWVKKGEEEFFKNSGFDGFYTYFGATGFTYGATPANWPYLQAWATKNNKIFIPSVAPGYIDTRVRPWNGGTTRNRENGGYYDKMFKDAIDSKVQYIGITSFNEWHEGTQIEPAIPFKSEAFPYLDYGSLAPDYYLTRTAHWIEIWEKKVPRVRFTGDAFAQQATAIFAETLQDMRNKIEYGDNSKYPAGFFHTSTEPNGVPQYYEDMWSRDCGRGLIELCRLGFADDAKMIARYFLSHKNYDDHWGREMHQKANHMAYEIDGNAWVLIGICQTWKVNGKNKALGKEFCEGMQLVVKWIGDLIEKSPYSGLLPSISELSGNPSASYGVYSIFGNYGIYIALSQVEDVATGCGQTELANQAISLKKKMEKALPQLISDGKKSYAPNGCWFNGIDSRNGQAYDMSEWDGTAWPTWHWTRQLPFIQDYDYKTNKIDGSFASIHQASYELIRHWMAKGEYFRKYGFVSNTGWTGMGGRHDETMCGYGQGFFTQAALMADDINAYTKCLEGIARLGYDGGVIDQLSYEKNPFVMHECFNFDNYEKGLDHTFGVNKEGRREIMENPGDEGNLVQEAEIIKAFSLVIGANCVGNKLVLMPRLPWLWDGMECRDLPVTDEKGNIHRINFTIKHERWLRNCTVEITGAEGFDSVDIRFGPFPRMLNNEKNYEIENSEKGCWIWKRNLKNNFRKITIEL